MENMRDVLKRSLGRSLEALSPEDRLAAAWPVACGRALAGRGEITAFRDGQVHIEVEDARWLEQFLSMRAMLERELSRIARVPVAAIHLSLKGSRR